MVKFCSPSRTPLLSLVRKYQPAFKIKQNSKVVGLHGADFKMPFPWLPQKALTVRGCHVGSSQQLRELIDLVRTGKIQEIPVTKRPLSEVDRALNDLKAGKVRGRIILTAD